MDRRTFLSLGVAPLGLVPAAQAARPMSRAARRGWLPNVPLIAHTGERVLFYEDLVRDRTVLLNFFFVGCSEGRCPTGVANLRKVQELLGERMGREIFFYSITLQPELDTPAVLAEYARAFEVGPGWLFLTGRPADIERLRRAQGFADLDPEVDKDPANHSGMVRYGNDRLERWGAVSLRAKPENIAGTFNWLSQ